MESAPTTQQPRNCVSCGRSITWDANVCPYCGHDYRQLMAGVLSKPAQASSKLVIGGVLILIGGVILLMASPFCFFIGIPLGLIAILGGIFAIQRKHFVLALIGGILTIPSILGLVGLILVIVSKDEFD